MKKSILIVVAFLQFIMIGKAQVSSLTGAGTIASPYLIGTVDVLKFFRDKINLTDNNVYDQVGACFKLTNDLDLSSISIWVSIGNNLNSANNFKFRWE